MPSDEPSSPYSWRHSLRYNVRRKTNSELAALLYKVAPQLGDAVYPSFQPVKVMLANGAWKHGYACVGPPRRRFRSEVVSRTDPCLWVAVPGRQRKFHITYDAKQLRKAVAEGRMEFGYSTRHAPARKPSMCSNQRTGKQHISW
jgi:hypothetical protein